MDPLIPKRGLSVVNASFAFPGTSHSQESSEEGRGRFTASLPGSKARSRSLYSLPGTTRGDQHGTSSCGGAQGGRKPGELGLVYSCQVVTGLVSTQAALPGISRRGCSEIRDVACSKQKFHGHQTNTR